MNEAEIRMAASMYSLVAEMNALNARIEGMKVANMFEVANTGLPMYNEQAFVTLHNELYEISKKLESEI